MIFPLLYLAGVIGIIAFVFVFASVLTNMQSYPRYKPTYDALTSGRYRRDPESTAGITRFYNSTKEDNTWTRYSEDSEILLFSSGSIKLIQEKEKEFYGASYIHSGSMLLADPYSFYWYYKINRWYKKNKEILINEEVIWHKIKK
jgi:hypothetical protein